MSALAGVNADIWLSTSPSTALGSPESFTDSGDHIHYTANTHRTWDATQTLTVQNSPNGSSGWVTVTDYTFYYPVGEIVFNSARVPGTNNFTRVSVGSFFTMSALDGAHMWRAQYKAATKESTQFQTSGAWMTNVATLKSATFNVDCYRTDARILQEMITDPMSTTPPYINISGGIVACYLYFDEANGKMWAFYAFPTGLSPTVAENDIDKQAITFAVTGPLYAILNSTFSTTTTFRM